MSVIGYQWRLARPRPGVAQPLIAILGNSLWLILPD